MKEEPCPIWSRVNAGGEILKEGVGRKSRWRHWQQWIRESPPLKSFGRAGHGTPLQSSCLENPTDRGAWWLQSMGSLRVRHTEWLHFHFSLPCIGEGNGNPLQCSCLENPRDGGAWWTSIYEVTQSWTWLKRLSSSSRIGQRIFLQSLLGVSPVVQGF